MLKFLIPVGVWFTIPAQLVLVKSVAVANYYNFIEAHTTTGKTPAELAGIKLEVGQNRWLGLIRISAENSSFH